MYLISSEKKEEVKITLFLKLEFRFIIYITRLTEYYFIDLIFQFIVFKSTNRTDISFEKLLQNIKK